MLLQERIEELNSGILKIKNDKVHIIGFLSQERLEDYYYRNMQCFFSNGIYDYEDLDFSRIKDNSLFLVLKDDKLINKYLYKLLLKNTFKYKTKDNKIVTKTFKIRKSEYSEQYNLVIDKKNLSFSTIDSIQSYLKNNYTYNLNIEELNK
ncbi:hypothetical protein [Clostridium septicum]|uniref:Uncharacterized protein n=1 Tax=Clostridium septicum TaxID=1504 RepID=A0A9N7JMZ8_CLOSE|nr:hypothetical protein [Clostridium septicum]AYE35418.1 hypothetical protein CP523_13810 [Clostridium septicum]MDU1315278.1 hypothetical protein [Clostridium septicum]QAS60806.1 hypothetical protein EI377_08705 [Clostridium septicum]UEC19928.1 hypothetical protein LK444_10965 [Clostridium septicum]USS02012.1 hypothetical protein NH397_06200 [Clostridium septicum]